MRLNTFRGRIFSFNGQLSWGEFYTGHSEQLRADLLWRASKFGNISLRYEKNIVNLPQGSFNTDLIGARLAYAVNPNLFGSVLGQWNNDQDEINFNFRLQFIPRIGTDFFFIVNQVFDTRSGRPDPSRGTVLGKLIWRWVV
jgi:hypothetical protein